MAMDSTVLLVDAAFAVSCTVVGLFAGWWLRKPEAVAAARARSARRRELEVARKIQALAALVAEDVGVHSQRISDLNSELQAAAASEGSLGEVVVGSLATILEANQKLQHQLTSAEVQLQRQAEELQIHAAEARRDPLTGLANRRALEDELARRFNEWKRRRHAFSVAMFDIDEFKALNDRFGHQTGDAVLKTVARQLEASFRAMDLTVRFGGEEFCVVLPATELMPAALAADRARRAVEQRALVLNGQEQRVTISVGVAEVSAEGDVDALIQRADRALYAAKHGGRNCVYVQQDSDSRPYASLCEPDAPRPGPSTATLAAPRQPGEPVVREACGPDPGQSGGSVVTSVLPSAAFHSPSGSSGPAMPLA